MYIHQRGLLWGEEGLGAEGRKGGEAVWLEGVRRPRHACALCNVRVGLEAWRRAGKAMKWGEATESLGAAGCPGVCGRVRLPSLCPLIRHPAHWGRCTRCASGAYTYILGVFAAECDALLQWLWAVGRARGAWWGLIKWM